MNKDTTRRGAPVRTDEEVAAHLMALARPATDPVRDAQLLDRIVAAAARTPRLVTAESEAAAPPVTATPETSATTDRGAHVVPFAGARPRVATRRADVWKIASVLAASLVLGFMAGLSPSVSDRAVNTLEDATGLTFASLPQELAATLASAEQGDF